jgi:hypothetical protein
VREADPPDPSSLRAKVIDVPPGGVGSNRCLWASCDILHTLVVLHGLKAGCTMISDTAPLYAVTVFGTSHHRQQPLLSTCLQGMDVKTTIIDHRSTIQSAGPAF